MFEFRRFRGVDGSHLAVTGLLALLALSASCAGPQDDKAAGRDTGSAESAKNQGSSSADTREIVAIPNVDSLRRDPAGAILAVKGSNLSSEIESKADYQRLVKNEALGDQARYFLEFYRDTFGFTDPRIGFVVDKVQEDDLGYTQVRLSQSIGLLPVRDSQLIVQFSPSESITSVQGRYLAGPVLYDLRPTIDEQTAEKTAVTEIDGSAHIEYLGLAVLLQSTGLSNLVHEFLITKSVSEKYNISVDAHSNHIVSNKPVVLTKQLQ